MIKISISDEIKELLPNFSVVAYTMSVDNGETQEVAQLIDQIQTEYQNITLLEDVVVIPKIKAARDGYKKCGKDPSRYRLATEALLRRVIRGIGLYRLGDIIDLGNILSIKTMRSICVVDWEKLKGNIDIRLGTKDDSYLAINRGPLNVDRMIIYEDEISPFGSPSSDTLRTAVSSSTNKILIMMICFEDYEKDIDEAHMIELYKTYANASKIQKIA